MLGVMLGVLLTDGVLLGVIDGVLLTDGVMLGVLLGVLLGETLGVTETHGLIANISPAESTEYTVERPVSM